MDRLDVAVLRQLFQGPPSSPTRAEVTLSYRKIAKRLGVSDETVRTRAKRLVDSGFIQGWMPHPNPNLLGMKVGFAMVDSENGTKDRVVEQCRLLEDSIITIDYHGKAIGVVFFYRDEKSLAGKHALLRAIAGGPLYMSGEILYPPCELRLSPTDWKVIAALQRAGPGSHDVIAKKLGISSRTVRRRVKRMSSARALFHLAAGDETKLRDTTRADLIVRWGDPSYRSAAQANLLSILDDYCFFLGMEENFGFFNLLVPSNATADGLLRKTMAVKGVDGARIEFALARYESYDVFKHIVDRKTIELGA